MGALGANINVGAISSGGLNGPLGDANAAGLSAMTSPQMNQLLQLIDGFSSAEILMALMMSAASNSGHKKHDGVNDAALGFLLGLSMASQIGQNGLPGMPQAGNIPGPEAATGGAINFLA